MWQRNLALFFGSVLLSAGCLWAAEPVYMADGIKIGEVTPDARSCGRG